MRAGSSGFYLRVRFFTSSYSTDLWTPNSHRQSLCTDHAETTKLSWKVVQKEVNGIMSPDFSGYWITALTDYYCAMWKSCDYPSSSTDSLTEIAPHILVLFTLSWNRMSGNFSDQVYHWSPRLLAKHIMNQPMPQRNQKQWPPIQQWF